MNKKDAQLIIESAIKRIHDLAFVMVVGCQVCIKYQRNCKECPLERTQKTHDFLVMSCKEYCATLDSIRVRLLRQIELCQGIIEGEESDE